MVVGQARKCKYTAWIDPLLIIDDQNEPCMGGEFSTCPEKESQGKSHMCLQAQADLPSVAEAGLAELAKLCNNAEHRPLVKSAGGVEVIMQHVEILVLGGITR